MKASFPSPRFLLPALLAGFAATPANAEDHARSHVWSMEHGTLVSNWSFENELDTWADSSANGVQALARAGAGFSARSGRFFGKAGGSTSSATATHLLKTPRIPVTPGESYTLSFYVVSEGPVSGGIHPVVRLWKDAATTTGDLYGKAYAEYADSLLGVPDFEDWTLYTMSFVTDSSTRFVEIALWGSMLSSRAATLGFDDVLLERGALPASIVSSHRSRIGYAVAFSDALGRLRQMQTLLPAAAPGYREYRVESDVYDSAGRPVKAFLPYTVAGNEDGLPDFQDDPLAGAKAYYDDIAPAPGMGNHPYSEVRYAPEPGARILRSAAPGEAWAMDAGRNRDGGYYFAASLAIPDTLTGKASDPGEREYRVDWTRDEDSVVALTWTDRKGQVVQIAQQADEGAWAISRTDYYPSGRIRRVRTPLDTSGATLGAISNFDSQGLLTSRYDPDRGLSRFWYNKRGMLRYAQGPAQRARDSTLKTYTDYDDLGNPVSTGEQSVFVDPQEAADGNGTGYPYGKIEHRGWLYGNLDDFGSRTGIPLDSIPYSATVSRIPRDNALRAAWNRNSGSTAPGLSGREKWVVDFYEYDDHGSTTKQSKYMGALKEHPMQISEYTYDEIDRPLSRAAYQDGTPTEMLLEQTYAYDPLGRVASITAFGDTVARYDYFGHGPLREVDLGRDGANPGLVVSYDYHARGWVREVNAVRGANGHSLWRQALGYETPALDREGLPTPFQASFTGRITQQVYHFTTDVPNPVRVVNYVYDRMGRLTTADSRRGSGLDASGALAFPLSLADGSDLDTRVAYDLNGRILGKRSGGVAAADSAEYEYLENSHRPGRVRGKLSASGRDASRNDNFAYDAEGRMTQDLSRDFHAKYADDGLPVELSLRRGTRETVLYPLYDATGYRVSQVTATRLARGFPVYWVGHRESGEPEDLYTAPDIEAALANAHYRLNTLNEPAPDTVVLYVIPDAGGDHIAPEAGAEYTHLLKGDTIIPVVLRGGVKQGAGYSAVMEERDGSPRARRHWTHLGGATNSEITEALDPAGGLVDRRVVANIYGQSAPIGRVTNPETEPETQYYVKNHLGSTVRVVNADGSFAETPTFDYQAYGELQSTRDDSLNPVSVTFTGKELDTDLDLYYFGARWYDPELGLWIAPDPAGDGYNAYSYVNGNPILYLDPNGLWKIGLGLSIGYTRAGGFSMGVGIGLEDVKLPGLTLDTYAGADRNFGDGSTSYSVQAGGKICVGLCLGAGNGVAYNTRSGYSADVYGSVGVGFVGIGDAGVEVGSHQYWDKDLGYIGGDVYGELNGNAYGNGAAIGYSHGFGAIRSGYYGELSAGGMSVSYHSAYGLDYGGSTRVASASYDSREGTSYKYLGESLVDYIASDKKAPVSPPNGKPTRWFWTNWCGPGGGGPSTSGVDNACIAHDAAYSTEGQGGILAATVNGDWALVSADFRLVAGALLATPTSILSRPSAIVAGPAVGVAFAAIGTYKTVSNFARGVGY